MIERDDAGRFVPGQSGNPNGRPRGVVRPLLREIVSEAHSGGGSKLEAMLRRVVDLALTEQRTSEALKAAAWVTEQLDGRVPTIDTEGDDDGKRLVISFVEAPERDSERPEARDPSGDR